MRYMTIYTPAETQGFERGAPPTEDEIARMDAFIQELAATGTLILTDGLQPTVHGAKVRRSGGVTTVTDGPFSEAKEIIGGFAIIDVPSKEEAIELCKRFLEVAGDGTSEVRLMYDQPAYEKKD